jgi:hypothetical protein
MRLFFTSQRGLEAWTSNLSSMFPHVMNCCSLSEFRATPQLTHCLCLREGCPSNYALTRLHVWRSVSIQCSNCILHFVMTIFVGL